MKDIVTLYGAFWCPDCHRSKQFLGEHQIPYRWLDVDDDDAAERFVLEANAGKRRIPTLVFADGTVLSNPSNGELADRLGLKTTAGCDHYDLVIVGGGPAGLTAALYTAREGIDTLVVERAAPGGQAAATMHLDNVPGFPEGVEGPELGRRFRAQAERFGAELLQAQDVIGLGTLGGTHWIRTSDGREYGARAVLLATGSRPRRLGVAGEERYLGAGVHFCATCDGRGFRHRRGCHRRLGDSRPPSEDRTPADRRVGRRVRYRGGSRNPHRRVDGSFEEAFGHPLMPRSWDLDHPPG